MDVNKSLILKYTRGQLCGLPCLHKQRQQVPTTIAHRSRCRPPSALQSKDPYKVLQITPGSSLADIKAAYYQKIKLLHPDVNENDTTEEAVHLNIAYATLLQGRNFGLIPY